MCSIFATIEPRAYAFQTRSVRIGGHATSVRLEAMFWATLDEIARVQGVAPGRFLSKLHDEVLAFDKDEPHNFASLLRCACLTYLGEVKGNPVAEEKLKASAALEFGLATSGLVARQVTAQARAAARS